MVRRTGLVLLIVALAALLHAELPIEDTDKSSLGISYSLLVRGQNITSAQVASYEHLQLMRLHYSPIPYVMISGALGADRFLVDEYNELQFNGRYGFTPGAGLQLYTPRFVNNLLSVTAGGEAVYLNSKDKYDNRYRGWIVTPMGGLRFTPGDFLSVTVGARGHIIYGIMENSSSETAFSNEEIVRGFGDITLHNGDRGVFLSLLFEASAEIGTDWSDGPVEASVGFSLGKVLRSPIVTKSDDEIQNHYFPEYKEMKKKQDKMAEELK
jgi:hypothetical protein